MQDRDDNDCDEPAQRLADEKGDSVRPAQAEIGLDTVSAASTNVVNVDIRDLAELSQNASAALRVADLMGQSRLEGLTRTSALAEQARTLAGLSHRALETARVADLAGLNLTRQDGLLRTVQQASNLADQFAISRSAVSLQHTLPLDPGLRRTIEAAVVNLPERLLAQAGLSSVIDQARLMSGALSLEAQVAGLHGASAAASRAVAWSTTLTELSSRIDAAGLGLELGGQFSEIARAGEAVRQLYEASVFANRRPHTLIDVHATFEATALKLSMFAGGIDTLGAAAQVSQAAFGSLLGMWRTRESLSPAFWRDVDLRRHAYRDASVDAGLVDADNAEVLEILVETGVVDGDVGQGMVTAFVRAGPVSVKLTASRPRAGAYRAITAFEMVLRRYVASKLESAQAADGREPRKWFKQRLPGEIQARVRQRREEARAAGESPSPSIDFVDLADFITIVTQGLNWPVFEPAFGNREALRVDLGRLNAIRRPTAHARPIDPVQLAEAVLTIRRLMDLIERDGAWDAAWNDDDG